MVLDKIPNTKIFTQRDVRETPAATATATSVGLTDPHYVTLQTDADLTNERVLTMGEGLDMTDAGAGSTLTINGENASDTNKGIASFALADFTVTAGDVALKDDIARTIDGDSGTATASAHNFDILGGTGISTTGASNDITINLETLYQTYTPIGSVLAWLKTFTNTPALPSGWVECNGQVLSDADSVYNGQTIPDLNGNNNFLRGNSTSGGTGGASTYDLSHTHTGPSHTHDVSGTTGSGSAHQHTVGFQGGQTDAGAGGGQTGAGTTVNSGEESSHNHSFSDTSTTGGTEATGSGGSSTQSTLPPYYNVVWIMRVK